MTKFTTTARLLAACFSAFLALGARSPVWSGDSNCVALITGQGEETRIVLENEFLQAVIAPHPSIGCIRELTYKPTGRQLSPYATFAFSNKNNGEGPATDRYNHGYVWRESKDFQYRIARQTPEEAVVELSYLWDGERDKQRYLMLFTKSYILRRGESRITVLWGIENKGPEERAIAPWMKHTMQCGAEQFTMLPQGPAKCPSDVFFDATTDWLGKAGAVSNAPEKEETFFVVCESKKVLQFYKWAGKPLYTFEAIYSTVVLKPGEKWSTTYVMGMTPNLPNIAYACPEGAIAMTPLRLEKPGNAEFKLQVAGVVPLGQVRLEGELLKDGKALSPTGDRRVEWMPGKTGEIAYSFNFPEAGAYMLRLNAYRGGTEQFPLGKEVSAYSPVVEIPIVVGQLKAGEVAMQPWPKKAVVYPPIQGRDLAMPVAAEAKAFRVGAPHPTEKVFLEDRLAPEAPRVPAAGIVKHAARGEWESIPLIVFPKAGKGLTGLKVKLPAFSSLSGATLRARLFQVSHIPVKTPSNFAYIPVGRYPDPLFPVAVDGTFDVPAGENAGFWINVQVPLDAPPGDYMAQVSIVSDQGETKIPIVVHVWNFGLPCPPALKTSPGKVGADFKGAFKALNYKMGDPYEEYCRWCLDYGFAPGHGRPMKPDEYVKWKNYNRGLSALNVGYGNVAPWATKEYMETNGFQGRMWVYAGFDEHGDAMVPKVAEWARGFKEKWPHVKILDVFYGINTQPLEGLVDIWCGRGTQEEWIPRRRQAGDEFWNCNGGVIWGVEVEVFPGRQCYWDYFRSGITGQLLWSMCCMGDRAPDFNGLGCNALAMLLYPSPGGLTTSIRWDTMRDGLEDYDYLWLLRDYARRAAEKGTADPKLLKQAQAICDDPKLPERVSTKESLEALRQEIGALIEKLAPARSNNSSAGK